MGTTFIKKGHAFNEIQQVSVFLFTFQVEGKVLEIRSTLGFTIAICTSPFLMYCFIAGWTLYYIVYQWGLQLKCKEAYLGKSVSVYHGASHFSLNETLLFMCALRTGSKFVRRDFYFFITIFN